MKHTYLFLALIIGLGFTSCDLDDIELDDSFLVAYIPAQCDPQPSFALGLKSSENKYYLVHDSTGKFKDLVQGDRVKVVYDPSDDVIVCAACNCPAPDGAMVVRELEKL